MPELPEVEVSRLGIQPYLEGATIDQVVVRQPRLRWPIPETIHRLEGAQIRQVRRRAKYLLLETDAGCAVLHLGMSGRLRVIPRTTVAGKHDHVDIVLRDGNCLRLTDPRRFGALLWTEQPAEHPLLISLGPEPLTEAFNVDYLLAKAKGRRIAIKTLIMDNHVVVGVGNIYANEALFQAGIDPRRGAGRISRQRLDALVDAIKRVLATAIKQGGTTLKDFAQVDGKPGYFALDLKVYGRAGEPCPTCDTLIESVRLGQRNTFYCPRCQR